MSWSLSFTADSKDAAVQRVEHEQQVNPHFNKEHADAVKACIVLVPEGQVSVGAYGHADSRHNNINVNAGPA